MPAQIEPGRPDLSPYAGLWVALVRGEISGVGRSAAEARLASLNARPKETPEVRRVPDPDRPRLALPPLFAEAREHIRAAQPAAEVWLAGGAVRDALLGRELHDLDFAVQGDALGLARAVGARLGGAFYPLDGERGTGRVILQRDGARYYLDFAALRAPGLDADLRLRDFTLNAMAAPLADPETVIDPLDGEADLRAGLLRACGPNSLQADPVRCLRAVRLAAQFDLRLHPDTRQAVRRAAAGLAGVSAERVRDEFLRLLGGRRVSAAVRALDLLGLLAHIAPETQALKGLAQPPPHVYDGWAHTLAVLERLEALFGVLGPVHDPDAAADLPLGLAAVRLGRFRERLDAHFARSLAGDRPTRALLFLAALLHDAGKPATRAAGPEGRITFHSHEQAGADLAQERALHLRLSTEETRRVRTVVGGHMRPLWLANEPGGPGRRAVYRFFRDLGEAGVDVCILALADALATWGPEFRQGEWTRLTEVAAALLKGYYEAPEQVVAPPALVSGRDLIEQLGVAEGPEVGRLLEAIREAQAAGEVADREAALRWARSLMKGAEA